MKNRILLLLVFQLLIHHNIFAQNINLKIKVSDAQSSPLVASTVILISNAKIVSAGSADSSGIVNFTNFGKGVYSLKVKFLGFDTLAVNNILLNSDTVINVSPKISSSNLDEVKITSSKPVFERKIDRLVFNVTNSPMSKGTSIWDLFSKVPGAETSAQGEVSIDSKAASIYINDRALKLSGEDLSSYLKNLSADNISKIEFIANPPAKYDAQGGAIINIITKKPDKDGFNGSVTSGYTRGDYNRINESANFNYRSGNLNIFGNYGFRDGKVGHDETEYIVFQTPSSYSEWDNTKHGYKNSPASTYELGVDYNIDEKNTIGLLIDGYHTSSQRTNLVYTDVYNNHRSQSDSILRTNNLTNGNINQYSFDLNYQGKLDTNGRTLSMDADFTPYLNNNNQSYQNLTYLPDGSSSTTTPDVTDMSRQKIDILTAKIDYSNPFRNKWRLDIGLKYSGIQNDNDFNNYYLKDNELQFNSSGSNTFIYSEKTSAAYASLSGKISQVSFQVGLREEYTRTSGYSETIDSLNKNSYFKLFPTVFLQYPIDSKNELGFYYGERISRPDYWRLNPFKYYSSPYTYLEGNPSLQPSFTHSFELSETYNRNYGIAIFYDQTNNVFSNITQQDNITRIFFDTQANLGKSIQTGIYGFATFNITDWWSVDNYLRGAYKIEQSAYLQGSYDYRKITGYVNTVNDFVLSKSEGLNAEISGWYSSPGIQGIFKLGRRYDLSTALSKSILNGQGNLRLSFTDLLNSNKYKIDVNYLDQKNGFIEDNDTRNVNFSFSFKFGNSKVRKARNINSSGKEEQNRASH